MAKSEEQKLVEKFAAFIIGIQSLAAESIRQNAENNERIRILETQVDNLEIRVFGATQGPYTTPPPPAA